MLAKVFWLCLLVGVTMASVYQGPHPTIPDELSHKTGCYIAQIKDVIPFDTTIVPTGHCIKILCGRTLMTKITCRNFESDDEDLRCYTPSPDLSKPFPDCCAPKPKCFKRN